MTRFHRAVLFCLVGFSAIAVPAPRADASPLLSLRVPDDFHTHPRHSNISLNAHAAPIRLVIAKLFDAVGANYEFEADVDGLLSLKLENAPFSILLHSLLRSNVPPLTYDLTGGIYHFKLKYRDDAGYRDPSGSFRLDPILLRTEIYDFDLDDFHALEQTALRRDDTQGPDEPAVQALIASGALKPSLVRQVAAMADNEAMIVVSDEAPGRSGGKRTLMLDLQPATDAADRSIVLVVDETQRESFPQPGRQPPTITTAEGRKFLNIPIGQTRMVGAIGSAGEARDGHFRFILVNARVLRDPQFLPPQVH